METLQTLSRRTVERYLAVRKPNTYRTNVTNKRIASTVVIIWLISLTLPQIYLYADFTVYGFIFANTSIVVAVSIICITYALMRQKFNELRTESARKRNKHAQLSSTEAVMNEPSREKLPEDNPQCIESTSAEANIQMESRNQFHNAHTNVRTSDAVVTRRQLLEAKVTKMFLIVLIALLYCYGPSTILMYFVNFCESCSCTTLHRFRDIHILFTVTNSSVNFFCYALRCTIFRNAIAKFLKIG